MTKLTFDLMDALDLTHRKMHRQVLDLRHEVIAHFGDQQTPYGRWVDERVMLTIDDNDNGEVSFAWERSNFKGQVVSDLSELIGLARRHLQVVSDLRVKEIHALLEQVVDDEFVKLLGAFRVDFDLRFDGITPRTGERGEVYSPVAK